MKKQYWLVWNGIDAPTYRHETLRSATQEAERLANKNPGRCFTVLEAIGTCVKNDLSWTTYGENNIPLSDVPF